MIAVWRGLRYIDPMATRPELREELLRLPLEEREALAEELFRSLGEEAGDAQWEAVWSDEIARRLAQVARGEVELVDADEVHAELQQALKSLRG
jgi:putative addiction module component (TIGR02574 family)